MIIAIIIFLIILLILAAWFFYKNFSKKAKQTVVQSSKTISLDALKSSGKVFKSGPFTQTEALHKGKGQAIIYTIDQGAILSFEDFSVTKGPDLLVYLSKKEKLEGSRPDIGEFVSLGKLKKSKGNQTYTLPENYTDYKSVLIWCRAFGILFSSASLV